MLKRDPVRGWVNLLKVYTSFTMEELKAIWEWWLCEYNKDQGYMVFGRGGDPSSCVFMEWLEKQVRKGKPLPTIEESAKRVKEYIEETERMKTEFYALRETRQVTLRCTVNPQHSQVDTANALQKTGDKVKRHCWKCGKATDHVIEELTKK